MTRNLARRRSNTLSPFGFDSTWKNLDAWIDDIDETFRSLFNDSQRTFDVFQTTSRYPKADVKETKEGLVFNLAVPGCEENDIDILFDKGVLTIKHRKIEKNEEKDENEKTILNELRHSSFERSWTIPSEVKEEEISASMKNGILEVKVPFVEPPQIEKKEPKKIEIKSE